MKITQGIIYLSASDLSAHISCKHVTWLNLQLAQKKIPPPPVYENPSLEALQTRGEEFEKKYIEKLKQGGKSIAEIFKGNTEKALEETVQAMRDGVDVIYQARLEQETWHGWADFLIKADKPGKFGDWSYEVMDTKLSKETKAGAILQISLYSEMLAQLQGCKPEYMYINNPTGIHAYRVDDFGAYYRLVKKKLLQTIDQPDETYPDPVPHCDICRWWQLCNQRRRDDDHLSFVAGMGKKQIKQANKWNVNTLEQLADLEVPLKYVAETGSIETYEKLVYQSKLQLTARGTRKPAYEILELEEGFGFYQLPEPSPHDMFFDFEGDPFVAETGLEYLFGWIYHDEYHDLWATHDLEEKKALEIFMDEVMRIRQLDQNMHIYHFGAYEPAALKRLVGKYATKEEQLDTLLRSGAFVNLHTITRHALRAGVESYSLKDLEIFHRYKRVKDLREVSKKKMLYEGLLESGYANAIDDETRAVVRDYNKDDCLSTQSLRNWLEQLRTKLINEGKGIRRPVSEEGKPGENVTEHQQKIKPLFDALMQDIPFKRKERSTEQEAKWLLANMLDWYRREKKSFWWEFFRLSELPDEDLITEQTPLAGLVFTGREERVKKSVVHYYQFPQQEFDLDEGDKVAFKTKTIGEIYSIDELRRVIGIKKSRDSIEAHPTNVVAKDDIPDKPKEEAIIRLAQYVVTSGLTGEGKFKAGRDLLLRHVRLPIDPSQITDKTKRAIVQVMNLDNSVLPIQGPPGTGKSHTAACMIIALMKAGKKIGVSALSHKVINGLLNKVTEMALREKMNIDIIQKVREESKDNKPAWNESTGNDEVADAIRKRCQVAAGTSFMWAREQFFESVDYLFVDEAGQLSLIDTIALAHAGKNLVLMGDPQQLKQPQKGSHPEGTEVSALEHVLQGEKTISNEQGLFLETTWRMHPGINDYISELFYDGRLHPKDETRNQTLEGITPYQKPGLYLEITDHEGNQNSSAEEVEKIVSIVNALTCGAVYWVDCDRKKNVLQPGHIKIISPYNAQVELLQSALPGMQIGTVDKFQGQEAPVIIFSMATSTPEDAPRGMEFLYSLNRLNVAVSRARAVFILVANSSLFEPLCKSPHQMQLANALCRLKEMAVN